ncbi:MAG: LacI family DNA-binding transcriptional regulator [Opitutales bacterium]|nr:LacI family DNA-binding transcriptional regulator [Opitutales bacterium]
MKGNVSLGEIAKLANVSTMTVSRALRNSPKVSAARRKEIQAIAKKLGYQPNPRLSRLMLEMRMTRLRGQSPVLAALHTFESDDILTKEHGPHLYAYLEGTRKRARDLGFRVDVFSLGRPPMKLSRMEQILLTRNVEGIVLFPYPYDRETLEIDFSHFPVAALGRSQSRESFHRASPNYFHAVEMAFERALDLGHRRIGALLTDIIDVRAGGRYSAAYLQLQERHTKLPEIPILHLKEASNEAIKSWVERERPDVIFGMGPRTHERLRGMGYEMPHDFSYVALELPFPDTVVSGINSNHGLVAEAAVDLIINQINANERGIPEFPKTVLIDGFWAKGTTFGKAPKNKARSVRKRSA